MAVFVCNFRAIFHSDTESDGSGVFHLLIVNVLTGVFRCRFCWDSHHINHGSTGTAVFWRGLHGCLRHTFLSLGTPLLVLAVFLAAAGTHGTIRAHENRTGDTLTHPGHNSSPRPTHSGTFKTQIGV